MCQKTVQIKTKLMSKNIKQNFNYNLIKICIIKIIKSFKPNQNVYIYKSPAPILYS